MNYYFEVLKKYAVFSGRARRKEYWYFYLFNNLIGIALLIVDFFIGTFFSGIGLLSIIYSLAVTIPTVAVTVRRFHDIDRSGWWLFVTLIPLVSAIVFFVFLLSDSQPGENQYGPNPKEIKVA